MADGFQKRWCVFGEFMVRRRSAALLHLTINYFSLCRTGILRKDCRHARASSRGILKKSLPRECLVCTISPNHRFAPSILNLLSQFQVFAALSTKNMSLLLDIFNTAFLRNTYCIPQIGEDGVVFTTFTTAAATCP